MPEAQIVRAQERRALAKRLADAARSRYNDEELLSVAMVILRYLRHLRQQQRPNCKVIAFSIDPTEDLANSEFLGRTLPSIRNEIRDPTELPVLLMMACENIQHYACMKFTAKLYAREAEDPELLLRAESATTIVPITRASFQK